jgi:hypothetical protein
LIPPNVCTIFLYDSACEVVLFREFVPTYVLISVFLHLALNERIHIIFWI